MGIPKFYGWLIRKYPSIVVKNLPSSPVASLLIDLNGIIHPVCHGEDVDAYEATLAKKRRLSAEAQLSTLAQESQNEGVLRQDESGDDDGEKKDTESKKPASISAAEKEGERGFSAAGLGNELHSEEWKFVAIVEFLKQLIRRLRPKAVVLAMDGVAPCAKGQQQRRRRYMVAATAMEWGGEGIEKSDTRTYDAYQTVAQGIYGSSIPRVEAEGNICARADEMDASPVVAEREATPPQLCHSKKNAAPCTKSGLCSNRSERFDPNKITAGTDFMRRLSHFLRSNLEQNVFGCAQDGDVAANETPCFPPDVWFSDSDVPGEGEHKLLAFMRRYGTRLCGKEEGCHVIMGSDADLILLMIGLHLKQIYVMREYRFGSFWVFPPLAEEAIDTEKHVLGDTLGHRTKESEVCHFLTHIRLNRWELVDVDCVSELLSESIRQTALHRGIELPQLQSNTSSGSDSTSKSKKKGVSGFLRKRLIDDFVVLSSLVGNDFLPKLPSAFVGAAALDNLLEAYVRLVLPHGFLFSHRQLAKCPQKGGVDESALQRLLAGYQRIEEALILQHCVRHNLATPKEAWHYEKNRGLSDDASSPFALWRQTYNLSTGMADAVVRQRACASYVQGIRFVAAYYLQGVTRWRWFYPFHYAPLSTDILASLTHASQLGASPGMEETLELEPTRGNNRSFLLPPCETPLPPLTQLVFVLPPSSAHFIPSQAARRLLLDPPQSLCDAFPREWDVDDTAADGHDYLATVLLPIVDPGAVNAELEKRLEATKSDLGGASECVVSEVSPNASNWLYATPPSRLLSLLDDAAELQSPLGEAHSKVGVYRVEPAVSTSRERATSPSTKLSENEEAPSDSTRILHVTRSRGFPFKEKLKFQRADGRRAVRGDVTYSECSTGGKFVPRAAAGRREHLHAQSFTSSSWRGVCLADFTLALLAMLWVVRFFGGSNILDVWTADATATLVAVIWLFLSLGIGLTFPTVGSDYFFVRSEGDSRGRHALTSWLCPFCKALNCARNECCFICGEGFEVGKCWCVFSIHRAIPLESDHRLAVRKFCIEESAFFSACGKSPSSDEELEDML